MFEAPHLFMSSFNELIGGRQASAYRANTAINMGLRRRAKPNRACLLLETIYDTYLHWLYKFDD